MATTMNKDRRIVFDLEWNQDYQSNGFNYYGRAEHFRGEIIQIGAVRLADGEEFSLTMKPRFFPKLNERIGKLTGLTQDELDAAISTEEGLQRFLDWCGEDAALLEWSGEDVLVLKQNLFLYGLGKDFPQNCYDVQAAFSRQFATEKREPALSDAVELLGIPEQWNYHEALADARYTAEICRHLDWQKVRRQSMKSLEKLKRYASRWKDPLELRIFRYCLCAESWRLSPAICRISCPHCGTELQPSDHWQKSPDNRGWYSLWTCHACKGSESPAVRGIIVRIREQNENRLHSVIRGLSYATAADEREWKRRYAIELRRRKKRIPQQPPLIKGRVLEPLKHTGGEAHELHP